MATAAKKKPVEKKIGRPKSEYAERYYLRHHANEIEAWRIAAQTSGLTLHQWMLKTLNGETANPRHVPIVKRSK